MVTEGLTLYADWSTAPCHRVYYDWLLGCPAEEDPNNYPEGSRIHNGSHSAAKHQEHQR